MVKVSASTLKDWMLCKRRWYYHRYRAPTRESSYFILGRVVHEAIEDFENGVPAEEVSRQIPVTAGQMLEKAKPTLDYGYGMNYAKVVRTSGQMFMSYLQHKSKAYGENAYVKESELQFTIPLVESTGIEYELIGKIDQVVVSGPATFLVDLKTSSRPPSVFDIAWDYQFSIYALAYKYMEGFIPNIYNFHLKSGNLILYPRGKEDLEHMELLISDMVYDLTHRKIFPRHAGYHCNSCQWREHCYGDRRHSTEL